MRGRLPAAAVSAVICTVDMVKRDSEIKLLLGCTAEETQIILATLNTGPMAAILMERPASD